MRRHQLIRFSVIAAATLALIGCAHKKVNADGGPAGSGRSAQAGTSVSSAVPGAGAANGATPESGADEKLPKPRPVPPTTVEKPQAATLDPALVDKANSVFEPVLKNDDKKAKLAYGRAHRFLPEILQLAFDLRFKNYEHALEVLPKTPLSPERKAFWQSVIGQKPAKLSKAICETLVAGTFPDGMTSDTSADELAWINEVDQLLEKVAAKEKSPPAKSDELDRLLNQLKCQDGSCEPIPEDLRPKVLTDAFFDKLHNWKRRDTRFIETLYKNLVQWKLYKPYVNSKNIFRLWKSLKASSDYPKQGHFLHRFLSIGRDMRSESGLDRLIGDKILDDQGDLQLARRVNRFNDDNALLTVMTGADHELASCHLAGTTAGKVSKSASEAGSHESGQTENSNPDESHSDGSNSED